MSVTFNGQFGIKSQGTSLIRMILIIVPSLLACGSMSGADPGVCVRWGDESRSGVWRPLKFSSGSR